MKYIYVFFLVVLPIFGFSQNTEAARLYAESISVEDLREHLTILASDALEGRETGQRGQKMAAAYIKAHFQTLGLTGPVSSEYGEGYFQKVPLYMSKPGKSYIRYSSGELQNTGGMLYIGSKDSEGEKELDLVFAGTGSEEELSSLDIAGKAVLVKGTGSSRNNLRHLVAALAEKDASALILASSSEDDWDATLKWYNRYLTGGRLSVKKPMESSSLPAFIVKKEAVEDLLKTSPEKLDKAISDFQAGKNKTLEKIKSRKITIHTRQNVQTIISENVLGYLEGSDKKEELIIITAHFDHVGKNGKDIYNGADDDGSGTVSVLEIAEAFVKAKAEGKGPRRSILFMTVTGEEKGLLGSAYYADHPVFPMENTVVNLNIDMIGRIDPQHKGNGKYVYLVGSNRLSTELHQLSEEVNSSTSQLELDYTYNDEEHPDRIYYRSDHWNFAKNNVAIIFYFNGIHEDYHKPSDTVDKIEFEALQSRAQLVFYTAWVLANREERISVDKQQGITIEKR